MIFIKFCVGLFLAIVISLGISADKKISAESYSMRPFDKMNRSNVKLEYNILNNVYRDIDAICGLHTGF